MVHREDIDRYPGTLAELAVEVGDLRYDALAAFLRALADKLAADAASDEDGAGPGWPRPSVAAPRASRPRPRRSSGRGRSPPRECDPRQDDRGSRTAARQPPSTRTT